MFNLNQFKLSVAVAKQRGWDTTSDGTLCRTGTVLHSRRQRDRQGWVEDAALHKLWGTLWRQMGGNRPPCDKSLVLLPFKALCVHFRNMKNAFKTVTHTVWVWQETQGLAGNPRGSRWAWKGEGASVVCGESFGGAVGGCWMGALSALERSSTETHCAPRCVCIRHLGKG